MFFKKQYKENEKTSHRKICKSLIYKKDLY